ncbi:hypothetical protein PSYAC_19155 [Pseudomonas syringae pv. actinidiae str. M302091]|nr:hypothetical protein PSYAC_19155 [Pseudomonas syringae pv. actinidiae str. M302091]
MGRVRELKLAKRQNKSRQARQYHKTKHAMKLKLGVLGDSAGASSTSNLKPA